MGIKYGKLSAKIRTAGLIRPNSGADLGTDKDRGSVLTDGAIVRGDGTSFVNKEAMERYKYLESQRSRIYEAFNRRFVRSIDEGCFLIEREGEAKEFLATLEHDTEVEVRVSEFELNGLGNGLDESAIMTWGERVAEQIKRVPLGRGKKDKIDADGVATLKRMAECPYLTADTKAKLSVIIAQAEAATVDRLEIKRNIELLDVKVDASGFVAPRRV